MVAAYDHMIKLSLICKKVYFLSHLISFYTWNVEIKHEKGYFFIQKVENYP